MKKNLNLLTTLLMSSLVTIGLVACNNNSNDTSSNVENTSSEVKNSNTDNENTSSSEATSSSETTSSEATSSSTDGRVDSKLSFDLNTPVTINLYTSLSSSASYGLLFDSYIEEFQELYPNITVNHDRKGGYDDVLNAIKTEIGSNSLEANLAYCYSDHVAYYNKSRCVQTLDKFIYNNQVDENGNYVYGMSDEQIDDFIDSYWNEGKSYGDDLMYTLPLYKSTDLMFYNVDVFNKHNLSVPTHWFSNDANDTTSMEYVCGKLRSLYPNDYPLGIDSEANMFITMCEQYGSPYTSATGDHYLFNNDTNKEFVKKFAEWYSKGYLTTGEISGAHYCSSLFTNLSDDSAKVFMGIGSSAGASKQLPDQSSPLKFEVGIAPLPQMDVSNPKAISQGPNMCIFKNDDQQKVMASWLLLRYLTTNLTFQAEMSIDSGYIPAIESVFENAHFMKWYTQANGNSKEGLTALSVKTSLDNQQMFYTSPAFVGSSQARTQVGKLLTSALQETNLTDETLNKLFMDAVDACKRDE